MRVHYISEHDDGRRIVIPLNGKHGTYVADVAAAGRECRRLLEARPTAFRVECWAGTHYVTKAQRGVEIESRVKRDAIGRVEVRLDVVQPKATGALKAAAWHEEPISGPELLAAIDAAPLSRETCDAVLDGMAANETPVDALVPGGSDAFCEYPPSARTREAIAAEREAHGPSCFETCCFPMDREASE